MSIYPSSFSIDPLRSGINAQIQPVRHLSNSLNALIPWDLANAALAKSELNQFTEADRLYTRAITIFGTESIIPAIVLANDARTKLQLNQFAEADRLYTRAITTYGATPVRGFVLTNAAKAKLELKQFAEADRLYTRAITAYGTKPI